MNINMNKSVLALLAVAVFSVLQAGAQTRPLAVLESPADARAASMGGVSLMSTDRSYLYINPASIFDTDKMLTVTASGILFPEYEGIDGRLLNGAFSAGWKFLDRHVVYAGFRYQGGLSYESVLDQFGTTGKKTSPFDWSVDMGYAFKINEYFSAFATGSFIQTYTGRTAYGAAFSLGGNYHTSLMLGEYDSKLNVAARVADFGTPVYYSSKDGYSLPTKAELTADLATSFNEDHKLGVVLGGRYYFLPTKAQTFQTNIGAEYTMFNIVSVRGGYQIGTNSSNFWSAGVGAQYYGVKLDFAYLGGKSDHFNNRMMLTLSFDY